MSASGLSDTAAPSSLAQKTAVVTGASRGIGRAIAIALVKQGVRTWLLARSIEQLQQLTLELGPLALALPCDVSDQTAVARAAQEISAATNGAPDILVNNAGLFPLASLTSTQPDQFSNTLAVNVLAPFLFVRAFLPTMTSRGSGHILTIGSVADRAIFPENGAYSASKFGQRAMHEVLLQEIRGSGVRASLVSPAPTDTNIWDPIDPDSRVGFPSRSAMLVANDVADAVLWVLSRPSTVNVDELRLSRS